MKKTIFLTLLLLPTLGFSQSHIREWATYFGDSSLYITGTTEFKGSLYLVGKTTNSLHTQNMATTGVAQPAFGGGASDGFIARLGADGQPVWFTYYGGTGDDEIYDIVADSDAFYIVGRTNSAGLATIGVQQTAINGDYDGFLAAFDEHGQKLWHTYIGGESEDETLSLVQHNNDIYLYGFTRSQTGIATTGSFQEVIYPTTSGYCLSHFISKYTKTGTRVFSSYYGHVPSNIANGTSRSIYMTGIAVNESGFYISGMDPGGTDIAYYGTPDAFLPVRPASASGTGMSLYVSKFSFGGSRIWSTYLSAFSSAMNPVGIIPAAGNFDRTRNLVATAQGVFISGMTTGAFGIATPLSFQPSKETGTAPFIVNFSNSGERLWGAYLGNFAGNDPGGLYQNRNPLILKNDNSGNIFISGSAHQQGGISTPNGYQPAKNRYAECFMAKISSDGTEKMYGTYYGGNDSETDGYVVPLSSGNGFYLVGTTSSQTLISSLGSFQEILFQEAILQKILLSPNL